MAPPRRVTTRLGEHLRAAREALGLDQVDVGKRVFISARQVSRWENGQRPTPEQAARIFDVLSSAPDAIVSALAEELGIELEAAEPAAPRPAVGASARSSPRGVAELRASFDAMIYRAAEDRDVLPRHLRAFAVTLFQGADRLGVSARDAALLVAERADGEPAPS